MRKALNAPRADADAKNVERLEAKIPLLRQKISKLEKAVEHARIHFVHYETALKYVKGIEYNLQTGQVLIYRDFVNQYSETGKKINNLIFVVIRPSPDGCGNIIDYVNNFAQAKCTSSFHATALDKLCQRADLLPPGTKLYISGDHSPHFWSWNTLMWQSTIFEKYKIKVEIVGLCSYHAYNRCDTHGAMIKKAAYRASTKGGGPVTSAEFRALVANIPAAEQRGITVCSSILMIISYLCFQAEDFGNLSVRDFPNKLLPRRAPSAGGIKTMVCNVCVQPCVVIVLVQMQFKYAFKGEDGISEQFEVGVVLARQFLEKGQWQVWDLRPDAEKWCHPCSSAAERIVRHNGRCPIPVKQKALREQRAAAARQAIEDRSRREREEGEQAAAAEAAENESGAEEQEGDASTAESDFDFPELAGPAAAVPVAPPPTASRTSTPAKPPAVARVAKRRMPPAVSSTAVSRSKRGASRGTKRVSLAARARNERIPIAQPQLANLSLFLQHLQSRNRPSTKSLHPRLQGNERCRRLIRCTKD